MFIAVEPHKQLHFTNKMEKTPKAKSFGFRSKKSATKICSSDNSIITPKELKELETLPVTDISKTPKTKNDCRVKNELISPQFRVGWDDGSDRGSLSMESPVYIPPVQRKIRRCPDELLSRASKLSLQNATQSMNYENDCDILQCVSWAKNLLSADMETTGTSFHKKNENVVNNSHIDMLDDSTDELLVLCSQAVEQSLSCSNNAVNDKRRTMSDHGYINSKKHKSEESPKSSKLELTSRGNILLPYENKVNKTLNFDQVNSILANHNENNNTNISNFNFHKLDIKNENRNTAVMKSNLVESTDSFKSFLDDEDEFSSIDFNYLDNLQSVTQNIISIESDNKVNSKPVVRYTKEQIERKRLEAQKKLLFNKKNRSM